METLEDLAGMIQEHCVTMREPIPWTMKPLQNIIPFIKSRIKAEIVTDWDGEENLRRNHRVKQECSLSLYIIEAISQNQAALRNEETSSLMICDIEYIIPVKTKLERMYAEWYNLPKVSCDTKSSHLSFAQYVMNHKACGEVTPST